MPYEIFIGLRYLRAKRRQTFVSVITAIAVAGVAVGVAALIVVLAGMTGVQEYMRDKILGFNAHLIVSRLNGIPEPDKIIEKIKKVPGVIGASPFVEGQALLKGRTKSAGVLIRGVDPRTVSQVMTISEHVQRGSFSALSEESSDLMGHGEELPAIAVGEDLALDLGLFLGDEVSVIIPEGGLSPLGMRPRVKRFRVGCIFKFGFYEVDSSIALISLSRAQQIFRQREVADGIEVKTADIFGVDKVKKRISEMLGPPYAVTTWFEQQRQLFAALKMEQLLSGLVLSLIMLVASFNIISMLLMLVMEKYRDIAILKSMGATDGSIMKIFMVQGTVIGLIGAAAGVGLGVFFAWLQMRYHLLAFDPAVYQFSAVPMKLTWGNVLGVAAGAVLLAFLTTLYPSWQAARSKPAESLRYE